MIEAANKVLAKQLTLCRTAEIFELPLIGLTSPIRRRRMLQQNIVVVKNAVKRYGKEELVLDGLNMTVSNGSVYTLLGASGCGKTTLLSCIVGLRYLDSGEMWVLGGSPDSVGCGIPGPRVGYMPQDTSLVELFSTSDALYYFGRINGLDDKEIANQLVKNMSGGQRRRVSFVAALMHKPEFLILDEPTVGLDPILRDNIWAYLIKLTQEEGTTVLMTTHYIEEAKQANTVSLMRHGKLLAESAPQKLLEKFQSSSLDEIFLKLCEAQNNAVTLTEDQGSNMEDTGGDAFNHDRNKYEQLQGNKTVSKRQVSRLRRFKALFVKNSIQFTRDYSIVIFAILIPIFSWAVLLLAIGDDPKNLNIGIVNDEAGNCDSSNFGNIWNDEISCHFSNLSCRFLNNLDDSIVTQKYYNNISEAKYDVQRGELHGIIYFHHNFSEALKIRVEHVTFAKDSDLLASQIQVFRDMSELQIGLFLQKHLFEWFLDVFKAIMSDCKYLPKVATPPIRFEDPIYGTTDLKYIDFVIPSILSVVAFNMGNVVSSILIITDREEGVWNRSLVQGVKAKEILLSHIVVESIITIIQSITIILLVFPVWGLECKGSILVIIFLFFLNTFCGMMCGFVISAFCTTVSSAIFLSIGNFLTTILMTGSYWPTEAMPTWLDWISYIWPTTLASQSFRGIIYKNSSISDSEVYIGFITTLGWTVLFFVVTIFGMKLKS
ncbi:PREDICTED: ABC transporter G family member 20-like isoform X2 [Vollenhovia emeryi]|uniref:ABC transporter G family member 20-like isoform X2 n=1 Tax=Vollenhovia emeryi TaxID=411798 RepID=UPI0005F3EA35|nr:PREDICTED: ABC transporter G family member 20-like isoform X2 [Vollenhovia emeryi]